MFRLIKTLIIALILMVMVSLPWLSKASLRRGDTMVYCAKVSTSQSGFQTITTARRKYGVVLPGPYLLSTR